MREKLLKNNMISYPSTYSESTFRVPNTHFSRTKLSQTDF